MDSGKCDRKDRLRLQYIEYLKHYGLEPRKVPEVSEKVHEDIVQAIYEEAQSRGDPAADLIIKAYIQNKQNYLRETRHPATVTIERTADAVEHTIKSLPQFKESFLGNVFVGEFPTGSINCEVAKVADGYIILMNSGMLMLVQQISYLLVGSEPDRPIDSLANSNALAGVIELFSAYFLYNDPYYGPKPIIGGMLGVMAASMSSAMLRFVFAHEYAHILLKHFAGAQTQLHHIATKVGNIEVIEKRWKDELEADIVGHKLTLGVHDFDEIDLTVIDRALDAKCNADFVAGCELKCQIAAPFLFLTAISVIEEIQTLLGHRFGKYGSLTHPPAKNRIGNMLEPCVSLPPRYSGYMNLSRIIIDRVDYICSQVVNTVTSKT